MIDWLFLSRRNDHGGGQRKNQRQGGRSGNQDRQGGGQDGHRNDHKDRRSGGQDDFKGRADHQRPFKASEENKRMSRYLCYFLTSLMNLPNDIPFLFLLSQFRNNKKGGATQNYHSVIIKYSNCSLNT